MKRLGATTMSTVNPMFQSNENEWAGDRKGIRERDHSGGSKGLWVFVFLLAVALGVAASYGYSAWEKQGVQLGQLLEGQGTVSALGQRVDTAEAKLLELTGGWEGGVQRVTKLEAKVQGSLSQTRRYA